MGSPRVTLRLVAPGDPPAPAQRSDLLLLAFLLALHLVPLLGALAGRPWGEGVVGYATVVVLLAGRELVREMGRRTRACVGAARDGGGK